jgi:large subunit ribosomal protein L10
MRPNGQPAKGCTQRPDRRFPAEDACHALVCTARAFFFASVNRRGRRQEDAPQQSWRKEGDQLAINREKKEELVALYSEHLENASAVVFTDFRGSTVTQINGLRARLKEADTPYLVVKNRLLRLALERHGITAELDGLLDGPNAVAFVGEDIGKGVTALKDGIQNLQEIIEIKGGILEQYVLDAAGAAALSELPTQEEMLAKLLATIIAPATQIARVVSEPGGSLARVVKAHADAQAEAA